MQNIIISKIKKYTNIDLSTLVSISEKICVCIIRWRSIVMSGVNFTQMRILIY
jgi:hypothetical protein